MGDVPANELKLMTELQRKFHASPDSEEETISSPFYYEFRKCTWYSSVALPLNMASSEEERRYTINHNYHYLQYTYLRQMWPAIRVKPEHAEKVRVCWPHNLGTCNVVEATLLVNDIPYNSLDSVWCDIFFQFYMRPGFRQHHNVCIGNVPILEKWGTFLPPYTTNVDQPWYYGQDSALAFPIFYFSSVDKIEHSYTYNTKIADILRMAVLQKGKWVEKKVCDTSLIEKVNSDFTLPSPQLWGRYAYISDSEISWAKCQFPKKRSFYIRDVVSHESPPACLDSRAVSPVSCNDPCLAMFWVAENQQAKSLRCFSNYTTNPSDCYGGWSPISRVSLTYPAGKRFAGMDADHFWMAEPRKHFPSPPSELGYHALSIANDSTTLDMEVGVVFPGMSTLSCTLKDGDPFRPPEGYVELEEEALADESASVTSSSRESRREDISTYILRVRMLVLKQLNIENKDGAYSLSFET